MIIRILSKGVSTSPKMKERKGVQFIHVKLSKPNIPSFLLNRKELKRNEFMSQSIVWSYQYVL